MCGAANPCGDAISRSLNPSLPPNSDSDAPPTSVFRFSDVVACLRDGPLDDVVQVHPDADDADDQQQDDAQHDVLEPLEEFHGRLD